MSKYKGVQGLSFMIWQNFRRGKLGEKHTIFPKKYQKYFAKKSENFCNNFGGKDTLLPLLEYLKKAQFLMQIRLLFTHFVLQHTCYA